MTMPVAVANEEWAHSGGFNIRTDTGDVVMTLPELQAALGLDSPKDAAQALLASSTAQAAPAGLRAACRSVGGHRARRAAASAT